MSRLLALAEARDDAIIGWKLAFGSPEGLARLDLTEPLVGILTARSVVESGSPVSLDGWTRPVAEPELAVRLGRPLPPTADVADVRAAISGIGPAIELADVNRTTEDVAMILSGNIYHRHLILGAVDETRAGGRLDGLRARVLANDAEEASTTDLESNTGRIPDLVATVARTLGELGRSLQAGQVVIAGSIVPPLEVSAGDEVVFHLEPMGPISVLFR